MFSPRSLLMLVLLLTAAVAQPSVWPTVPIELEAGQQAWVYADSKVMRLDFVKKEPGVGYFTYVADLLPVPSVMIGPRSTPAKVRAGSRVLVDYALCEAYGIVQSVSGRSAKVKAHFGTSTTLRDYSLDRLIALDGQVKFGAPVAYKHQAKWHSGIALAQHGQQLYIDAGGVLRQVSVGQVQPMALTPFQAGDEVSVASMGMGGDFVPGIVKDVVDDGLTYRIQIQFSTVPVIKECDYSLVTSRLR